MRARVLAVMLLSGTQAGAQSFTCRIGTDAACLEYGDTVCTSAGMCVDRNAECFDRFACDYEGFTCQSNVSECVDEYRRLLVAHDDLLAAHNDLVDEINDLFENGRALIAIMEDQQGCVLAARDLDQAQGCF